MYKVFKTPHLDYGGIIYDEAYNASFHHKLELFQYNVCLTITGAIEVHLKKSFTKNYVWRPFSFDVGSENYVFSTKFIKIINLVIFPISFHNEILLLILEK